MPFVSLSKLAKNENHVKLIFDYVKNIGVSALIVAAGKWQIENQLLGVFSHFYGILVGYILSASGFCLLFINQEFIIHQIDKYNPSKWLRVALHAYIFMIAILLFIYLLGGNLRHT